MDQPFTDVTSEDELDRLIANSDQSRVVLFKHDWSCPISAGAYDRLSQLPAEVAMIDVNGAREVSQELAARTGIKHESPQVIVMDQGKAVWNASHHAITREAVEQALAQG